MNSSFTHDEQSYYLRKPVQEDMPYVTSMMNEAFSIWSYLGRGSQSEEIISLFMLEDGFLVFSQEDDSVCGTICMREAQIKISDGEIYVNRAHRVDHATLFDVNEITTLIQNKKFHYLYGLSVKPELAKSGLGRAIAYHVMKESQQAGFDGVMLETGKDTGWLVELYQREGFKIIGEGVLEGANVRTVIMLKLYHL
jgi:ribosomal protein S18 acetylase RimI-like enzyme